MNWVRGSTHSHFKVGSEPFSKNKNIMTQILSLSSSYRVWRVRSDACIKRLTRVVIKKMCPCSYARKFSMEYVCADIHVAKVQPRTTKTKLRDSFTEQTREISFSMTTTDGDCDGDGDDDEVFPSHEAIHEDGWHDFRCFPRAFVFGPHW